MLFSILEKQHFSLLDQAVFFLPTESLLFLPLVSGSGARPRPQQVSTHPGFSGLLQASHLFLSPSTCVSTLFPNVGIVLFLLLQRDEATWWY